MGDKRALIVETGLARGALAGARGLRAAGWRVGIGSPLAGISARSRAVGEWHHLPALELGREPFVEAVQVAVRARGYDIVFAAGDAELIVISEERERVGAAVPHPPPGVLLRGLDKLDLMRAARDAGLDVPETLEADASAVEQFPFPLIVKPRLRLTSATLGPGQRLGTRLAATAEDARAHIAEIEAAEGAALVQERLSGSLMAWIGVLDDQSRVLVEVQQYARRLWPPNGGVSARAVTVPVSPAISESARGLLEGMSWSGLVQLQFILGPDGRARLIDLNPRFYGSMALAIGSGANLPAVWAATATGRDVVAGAPRPGERYHWLPGDLQALLAGPTGRWAPDLVGTLRWAVGAHHSVWSLRDPAPSVWYLGQLLRRGAGRPGRRRGHAAGAASKSAVPLPRAPFVDPDGVLVEGHEHIRAVECLVEWAAGDASALLASLARQCVPCAAADRIVERLAPSIGGSDAWREAVAADRLRAERMSRAIGLVEEALDPVKQAVALTSSPLGPLWSSDVDVLVLRDRLPEVEGALRAAGFLWLGPLLAHLGHRGGAHRYVVMDGAEPLASVELSIRLHDRGPNADEVIARAWRPPNGGLPRVAASDRLHRQASKITAGRRATVRGVLELAALRVELQRTPARGAVAAALRRSGRLERRLDARRGASGLVLRPSPAWFLARIRNARQRLDRLLRGRRLVVAFSGIDGSGKSTQVARLADSLKRAGVPTVAVWSRIGFSGSPLLSAAARAGRRVLPAGSHSAQRARAQGTGGAASLTRRGPIGWSWALAVTLAYLRPVRAGVRRARGRVIILDRGLPDALVDLEKGFSGKLDLSLHRWLIHRLAPRADVIFYLRMSGAAAYERKRDLFTASVLQSYAERLDQLAPRLRAVVLDAERPAGELAIDLLRIVAEVGWRAGRGAA